MRKRQDTQQGVMAGSARSGVVPVARARWCLGLIALVCSLLVPKLAFAADAAAAEALFRQGRELLDQKKYAEACPKFEESQRLDPATGTLFALALCHEGLGKLATAWGEFVEVQTYSRRDGRMDRAQAAKEHADALLPRLSYLTIELSPEAAKITGLVVKRDGVQVGAGALGVAVPVDPGDHQLEASAPGMKPWVHALSVSGEATRQSALVPALEPLPEDEAEQESTGAQTEPAELTPRPEGGITSLQVGGIISAAIGVVGLGAAGYFTYKATSENKDSEPFCQDNRCAQEGYDARKRARNAGDFATGSVIVGAVGLSAGVAMWFLGAPSADARVDTGRNKPSRRSFVVVPMAAADGASLVLSGIF